MAERLSTHLRENTRAAHGRLRMGPLLRAYFRGRLDARVVAEGLAALHLVYGTLERRLDGDEAAAALGPREVRKAAALANDLRALADAGGPAPTGPHPAAVAYAAHIDRLDGDTMRLAAHAYARYMGDLAGGPIARRAAPFVLRLPRGLRLAYLELPGITDLSAFKERYRRALDALPVEDRAAMVEEVLLAFSLHHAMAQELWDRFVEPKAT